MVIYHFHHFEIQVYNGRNTYSLNDCVSHGYKYAGHLEKIKLNVFILLFDLWVIAKSWVQIVLFVCHHSKN